MAYLSSTLTISPLAMTRPFTRTSAASVIMQCGKVRDRKPGLPQDHFEIDLDMIDQPGRQFRLAGRFEGFCVVIYHWVAGLVSWS